MRAASLHRTYARDPYEQGNIFNHDPLRGASSSCIRPRSAGFSARREGLYARAAQDILQAGRKWSSRLRAAKRNYDKRQALHEKTAKRDVDRHSGSTALLNEMDQMTLFVLQIVYSCGGNRNHV